MNAPNGIIWLDHIGWKYNDGGRSAAGFRGETGDCVTRAIAIATCQDYLTVYNSLNGIRDGLRQTKRVSKSSARDGVVRNVYDRYLKSIGWFWTPVMSIGSGCQMRLHQNDLPAGTIIARVTHHMVAVIDGVIHDTHDCSRGGTRCVYGYWSKQVSA